VSVTGYSIQENLRAKCVRVKVSLYDGRVVVVVPPGFDRDQIPEIVREKQSWIARAQRQVNEQRELAGTNGSSERPEQVLLRALGEEWKIRYDRASTSGVTLYKRAEGSLLLRGEVENTTLCQFSLQRWVKRKAHSHLVPWLQTVSRYHDLPVTRVAVRAQRSRWGSCSRHHTISINQKLLFIPPALVRYVFLHELCHVVHFDHSPAFWRFLEQREPRCRELDVELDTAWRYVPLWASIPTP
jgi:predicted metal-dependent hydrolase